MMVEHSWSEARRFRRPWPMAGMDRRGLLSLSLISRSKISPCRNETDVSERTRFGDKFSFRISETTLERAVPSSPVRKRDKGQFDPPITRATRTGPDLFLSLRSRPPRWIGLRALVIISRRVFFSRERVVGPRMRKRPKRSRVLARPSCFLLPATLRWHVVLDLISSETISTSTYSPILLAFPNRSPLSPCYPSSLPSHLLYLDLPFQIRSSIREYPKEGDDRFASSSPPQSIPSKRCLLRCRRRALIDHSRLTRLFSLFLSSYNSHLERL